MPGDPRDKGARRLGNLRHEVRARRQPGRPAEIRRGGSAAAGRLSRVVRAENKDAALRRELPARGPAAIGPSLRRLGTEGQGRRLAKEIGSGEAGNRQEVMSPSKTGR